MYARREVRLRPRDVEENPLRLDASGCQGPEYRVQFTGRGQDDDVAKSLVSQNLERVGRDAECGCGG